MHRFRMPKPAKRLFEFEPGPKAGIELCTRIMPYIHVVIKPTSETTVVHKWRNRTDRQTSPFSPSRFLHTALIASSSSISAPHARLPKRRVDFLAKRQAAVAGDPAPTRCTEPVLVFAFGLRLRFIPFSCRFVPHLVPNG